MLGFFSLNSAKPVWSVFETATPEEIQNLDSLKSVCTVYKPLPLSTHERWGDDVRINDQDSVIKVSLDIHRASGNLFAAILSYENYDYHWTLNYSTDGGSTWTKTYDWITQYGVNFSICVSVLYDLCYVAYSAGDYGWSDAIVRRFRCSDGQPESFSSGSDSVIIMEDASGIMQELVLTSFADGAGNRLYCFLLTEWDGLFWYWTDSIATTWTELSTGANNVRCGLDACTNQDHTYYLLFSCIDSSNNMNIYGRRIGSWDILHTYPSIGSPSKYTAISAYNDTVACVFEFTETAIYHIRGVQSNTGGSNWFSYSINDPTSVSPDITLRNGGGVGLAYQNTVYLDGNFIWGNYDDWYLGSPTWFTEYQFVDNTKPSIEYLDNGVYGVTYIGYNPQGIACAYFDRSDWTGIKENTVKNQDVSILTILPNPSSGTAILSYNLRNMSSVKISIYDTTGRLLDALVDHIETPGNHSIKLNCQNYPAGTYFIQMETSETSETKPLLIVK
jgi:hypothetical protein